MSDLAHNPSPQLRVLVVEDDRRICELLSDVLEGEGLAPYCVQSDRAAYEVLKQGQIFSCMVVDVNQGVGTNGFDVARYARQIDPQIPIVYVSGQASPASFAAFGVPGSLFLPKPFSPDELMQRLRKLVGDNDD
jgi:CheY-like chemotaxis protein